MILSSEGVRTAVNLRVWHNNVPLKSILPFTMVVHPGLIYLLKCVLLEEQVHTSVNIATTNDDRTIL